jgi:sugar lactone lactonase YvrE
VILYVYFVDKKYAWRDLIFYLAVAAGTFFILDPAIWQSPVQRLYSSLFFHAQYAESAHVQEVGYPWYQPLIWLAASKPFEWHPGVFFYNPAEGPFSVDGIIFILALFGLVSQWRQRRYVVVWILVSVLALLFWPTKWPQYILVVVPAFCLAASATLRWIIGYFRHLEDYYGWVSTMIPLPSTVVWIALILAVGFFGTFTAVTGVNIYLAHQGWSHQIQDQSLLPSNAINAILATPQGQMVVGTNQGIAIWSAGQTAEVVDHWQILNSTNSGLPDNEVLSLQTGPSGELWIGTGQGLARYDGKSWKVFDAPSMGLPEAEIHDIQYDRQGRLWVGGSGGAAVYDNQSWRAYTPENSGLSDSLVLSIATSPSNNGEWIYFGTSNGLYSLDVASGEWNHIRPAQFNRKNGGIADLMFDSKGRLWVATWGSGLQIWDGKNWLSYTTANSDLPTNRVDYIAEGDPGVYWIGVSYPNQPGGILARFDGNEWKRFESRYTGYSGGATVAIAKDPLGRLWLGTQTLGVDIYDPTKKKN